MSGSGNFQEPTSNPQALIELLKLLAANPKTYFQNNASKAEFKSAAHEATIAVEEPFETLQRIAYGVSI